MDENMSPGRNEQVGTDPFSSVINRIGRVVKLGKAQLQVGAAISGIVCNSKHDRVSVVSGGGSSSTYGSFYQGMGHMESKFSFSVSTKIDVRHEFWIRQDDIETEFVFPIHFPVTDGQKVSITQVSGFTTDGSEKQIGFVIDNFTAKKTYLYPLVGDNKGKELLDVTNGFQNSGKIFDVVSKEIFNSEREFYTNLPDKDKAFNEKLDALKNAPGNKILDSFVILEVVAFICGVVMLLSGLLLNYFKVTKIAEFLLSTGGGIAFVAFVVFAIQA